MERQRRDKLNQLMVDLWQSLPENWRQTDRLRRTDSNLPFPSKNSILLITTEYVQALNNRAKKLTTRLEQEWDKNVKLKLKLSLLERK